MGRSFPPDGGGSLSRDIADAAGELACRIELGEFDDLDEAQMQDLRGLLDIMAHWAALAQALEERYGHAQPGLPMGSVAVATLRS